MQPFEDIFADFMTLLIIVDPIGSLSIFLAVTKDQTVAQQRRTAVQANIIALCVLMGFLVVGQIILEALGIGMDSFKIAGGLVLFLFALQMIFGSSSLSHQPEAGYNVAVFPLAVPSLAGAGSMLAVVTLTDNNRHDLIEQATTAGVVVLVICVTTTVMLLARPLRALLGQTGASVLSRVMGLILAALSVQTLTDGIKAVFP